MPPLTTGRIRLLAGVVLAFAAFMAFVFIRAAFVGQPPSGIVVPPGSEHPVLRAIGAPPGFLLAALWLELGAVLAVGVLAGTGLGWALAGAAGSVLGGAAGVQLSVAPGWSDAGLAAAVLAGGLVAAALPALAGSRVPPGAGLKG